MAIGRRIWRVILTMEDDGTTIASVEVISWLKPEDDAENPDMVMPEIQDGVTLDLSALTPGQATAIANFVTVGIAPGLARVKPINPGPST